MRTSWGLALGSVFGGWVGAPPESTSSASVSSSAVRTSVTSSTTSRHSITATPTSTSIPTQTGSPCGAISAYSASFFVANPDATRLPPIPASDAMACLQSVPLDVDTDLAFLEYVEPFIQFQSTQAYLKNPPSGYIMDGVDLFGGIDQIAQKLQTGGYKNQYAFEKDIFALVNVLPRDFHFNLPLPLIQNIFVFGTTEHLVSVSLDGKSLPQVFSVSDLQILTSSANSTLRWKPSAIVKINGQPVADYLLQVGLGSQQFSDPDAIYNKIFTSLAGTASGQEGAFTEGGFLFGFDSAETTFVFANGTNTTSPNLAAVVADFTDVTDGATLFQLLELPPDATAAASTDAAAATTAAPTASPTASAVATPSVSTTTQLPGYPSPIVIHRDGYTSGYFLPNSSIAVLSLTAFTNQAETVDANPIMQAVVKNFLQACRMNKKTKLIIDLQENGGGSVLNGIDTFKQLFPTIDPFAATRFRETPIVDFLAEQFSDTGVYNDNFSSVYQIQANVDMNEHDFTSVKQFVGPYTIYNDTFTSLVRMNLSDPVEADQNDIFITGAFNTTGVEPQEFTPDNIVMIHDGGCGSTCAIFFELMKAQGGVRSIAVGGRPQNGPMQGVAGSKGAQVFAYIDIIRQFVDLDQFFTSKGQTLTLPTFSPEFNISFDNPPLGINPTDQITGSRFNLRNNYNSSNPAEFPLQFVYEAANCRLFYQPADVFDISALWQRVANTVWGNGKCVSGSSPNKDDSFPTGAYNTVPFSAGAMSNVSLPFTVPGFVKNNETGPKATGGNGTGTTSPPLIVTASGAVGLSARGIIALMVGVMGAVFAL